MNSTTTEQFWMRYSALPTEVRRHAREAYSLFILDPYHPSLHFKRIHSTRPVFSVRIGNTIDWSAFSMSKKSLGFGSAPTRNTTAWSANFEDASAAQRGRAGGPVRFCRASHERPLELPTRRRVAIARLPKTPLAAKLNPNGQETPPRGVSPWRNLFPATWAPIAC